MRARPNVENYPKVDSTRVDFYNKNGNYYISDLEQWADEAEKEVKELRELLENLDKRFELSKYGWMADTANTIYEGDITIHEVIKQALNKQK